MTITTATAMAIVRRLESGSSVVGVGWIRPPMQVDCTLDATRRSSGTLLEIARRTRDPHTPETDLPASGGAANRARRRKFLRQTSRSLMESSLDGIALDLWEARRIRIGMPIQR